MEAGTATAVEAGDFALLRVVNEGHRTPVFWTLRKMHRNACQCWLLPHLVIISLLIDLLSFPIRCILGISPDDKRLLLRYQFRLRPDVAMSDDLITDLVLGPAVSKDSLALEIVAPGSEDPSSTSLSALRTLLTSGDATGFKELARSYVTPKSLEPRSCPNERMEAVKAAALAISAETFRRGAGEETDPPQLSQKWVQVFIHFDGRVPLYFCDWQWGTWFWYCGRRYPLFPVGIFFVMFALLCNLADVMMAPFIGIMYLVLGTKGLQWDAEGKHEVKAYLYTLDQGGEGVEYKTEGYMAVLRSDYNGPSYITGFNKCCRGSYQRWALKELLRSFEVPQEVNLYQDFGCYFMATELQLITREEMLKKIQGVQTTCGCCC